MSNIYIKAGMLIDGTSNQPKTNVGILIRDNRIVEINDMINAPENCEVYDYSDKIIMPGLINCHVHIAYVGPEEDKVTDTEKLIVALKELKTYLKSGVTHVRVCGASTYLDIKLRDAMKKGLIEGPGIIAAGRGITMTGGSGHASEIEADGVDECRKAARYVIKKSADFIKIVSTGSITTRGIEPGAPQLTYEELKAAIDEAHKAGKTVGSHSHGTEGIKNAILAGVDSIEHGSFSSDETISLMKEKGTYLVPTLSAPYFLLKAGEEGRLLDFMYRKAKDTAPTWYESFRNAYKAGVKIAMGSDAYGDIVKPEDTWHELRLMIENGMSPMEAIQVSTQNSANLLRISDDYGTIEKGKVADFIVLNENPLTNIETLSEVYKVFKNGQEQIL